MMTVFEVSACKKDNGVAPGPPGVDSTVTGFSFNYLKVDGQFRGFAYDQVGPIPVVAVSFTAPVNKETAAGHCSFVSVTGGKVPFTVSFGDHDSTVLIQPSAPLAPITAYRVQVAGLENKDGGLLLAPVTVSLTTAIDSSDKFTRITDSALLDLVERQTFRYFWDFGHPVSGMARERNSSGDVCTTGGTGFGIMCMLVAIRRQFISRSAGLTRIQQITDFLTERCTSYHGAFSHWINGATGATVPFSAEDDGADLVETAYLMAGLLCARQYFDRDLAAEDTLRKDINTLWNRVEWTWFQKNGGNLLYWHWSPDMGWIMNVGITGWNETLITYVLAASANRDSISKKVYDQGWASGGAFKNGHSFYGIELPLGPDYGGPLFFAHYSFLGLNPHGLSDAYADYWTQDTAQVAINYLYCIHNPSGYSGYSASCWGLTASDDNNGYAVHSPTHDDGVISPTAAISSMPYQPSRSLDALRFFYYKLGDKLWGPYGFRDAFNLSDVWFSDSYLAIDQGPEMIMVENYRTGLLWNLLMSCPEIKRGLKRLGFSSPYL